MPQKKVISIHFKYDEKISAGVYLGKCRCSPSLSFFKLANSIHWDKNCVGQCVVLNKGIKCIVERSVVNVPEQTHD